MLLEITGCASQELYEEIIPRLKERKFSEIGHWADPESDGEYMGWDFEYQGAKPLSVEELYQLVQELLTIPVESALIPAYEFKLIKDKASAKG
ncbi:MAG: hypothetical protein HYU64_00560 [Armatimonadetes bacterium]|nr:hypothetical protein [Armatimonadota bacterium]